MSGASAYLRAKALACKRRLSIALHGDFDPYPLPPQGVALSPSEKVAVQADSIKLRLDWRDVKKANLARWKKEARGVWHDLLRLNRKSPLPTVIHKQHMSVAKLAERTRYYLRFAPGCDAPVDVVRHNENAEARTQGPVPVVICMQGTNAGAHLNLGEVRMPADVAKVANGSALALQASDEGFIAVSFERACFGERRERKLSPISQSPTVDAAFHSLLLGQSLLGQTVAELTALRKWIDAEVAPGSPVYLAGYSAAGTAAIAAAAADPEFAGVAVGGCVGMMRDTILRRRATGYNDIPDILEWFEFDALIALIAPRPCIIIAGERDHIWPASGAEKVVNSAKRAWEMAGRPDHLIFRKTPGIHTYYPEIMWPAFRQLLKGTG